MRPVRSVAVVGNCLAESMRLLLEPTGVRTVAVAPVFELDAAGAAALHRELGEIDALVVQPIRDDYRGLPLGTDQLRSALAPDARCVVFPVVRHAALHPHQVLHHPPDGTAPPPVVPYHDLRTVRRALGEQARPGPDPDAVRRVAEASIVELRRREAGTDVAVSDLLTDPGPEHLRTVNHPGNPVLVPLAGRIAERLGLSEVHDPGRPLLASVRAPIEEVVAETWGFDLPPGSATWWIEGREVPDAEVVDAHLRWYAEHPEITRTVHARFADRAAMLGLT